MLALILALSVVFALSTALRGNEGYYRPTQEAARAIVRDWQQRHPGERLGWVGGDWAGNAMLAFYAQPHLLTVPGLPDSKEARMLGVGPWQARDGVLLCLRGPLSTAQDATDCDRQARQWLAARGRPTQPHVLQVARSGWRFPRAQPWVYAVYDVDADARP